MRTRLVLFLFLCLIVSGCAKYKSREDFAKEKPEVRISFIKDNLKDQVKNIGQDTLSKYYVQYIDYVLTKSKAYNGLRYAFNKEGMSNPTLGLSDLDEKDYDKFLQMSIKILYYSYCKKTYWESTGKNRGIVESYLELSKPRTFNDYNSVYRRYLSFLLKPNVLQLFDYNLALFPFYHPKDLDRASKGYYDKEETYLKGNFEAYYFVGYYGDFKFLDPYHQSQLLYSWFIDGCNNSKVLQSINIHLSTNSGGFNNFANKWSEARESILSPLNIPNNIPLISVKDLILGKFIEITFSEYLRSKS